MSQPGRRTCNKGDHKHAAIRDTLKMSGCCCLNCDGGRNGRGRRVNKHDNNKSWKNYRDTQYRTAA